jgi:hypothetical protein
VATASVAGSERVVAAWRQTANAVSPTASTAGEPACPRETTCGGPGAAAPASQAIVETVRMDPAPPRTGTVCLTAKTARPPAVTANDDSSAFATGTTTGALKGRPHAARVNATPPSSRPAAVTVPSSAIPTSDG